MLPQLVGPCRRRVSLTSTPLCRIEPFADPAVQTVNHLVERFLPQQPSSGTGCQTMSHQPIRCQLSSSN